MKIAMMTNNYKPYIGGVPVSVERLSNDLRELGHQVTIFAPTYKDQVPEPGVFRYRSTKKQLNSDVVMPNMWDKNIRSEFARHAFDIVHLHHPMLIGHTGMFLAKQYDLPVAFTYHTRYEEYIHHINSNIKILAKNDTLNNSVTKVMTKAVKTNNKWFINNCDVVFAPTPIIKDFISASNPYTNIKVLPTGLGDEDFCYDNELTKRLREEYRANDNHLFCSVARLEKEKNIKFLISSMKKYKENTAKNFKLLIIGDGSQRKELEDYSASLDMMENIKFVGSVPRDKMSSYYNACELFVFASKSETQGIVLLEAMAAGLPVAAIDASGVCDVVVDGVNGYRVESNESLLAYAVAKCLQSNTYKQLQIGAKNTAINMSSKQVALRAEAYYLNAIYLKNKSTLKPRNFLIG